MAQEKIERLDHYGGYVGYHDMRPDAKPYESGVGLGESTLDKLKERLAYYIRYYENLGCQITTAYVERFCSHCNGTGKVPSKRSKYKHVRCPACKDKDTTVRLETWVMLPKPLYRYGPELYRHDVFADHADWENL